MNTELKQNSFPFFDGLIFLSILLLSGGIYFFVQRSNQVPLKVQEFSWHNQKIGSGDRAFTLTFNHPINQASVEKGLNIQPPLNGKISWSENKLFYTLSEIPIYGISYQVRLNNIKTANNEKILPSFVNFFKTDDRSFAYLGTNNQEKGRLILYNITKREKTILTPADLNVTDFRIPPRGEKIFFLAYDSRESPLNLNSVQQLYTVSTGFKTRGTVKSEPVGRLHNILNNREYANIRFDLSKNGRTLIVERESRKNPADAGLWLITESGNNRPLGIPGGQFALTPNGQRIALKNKDGITILPLYQEAGAAQVLPGYEAVLDFSSNSSQVLMVKNNNDYTRSVVLVNQKGDSKELFRSFYPVSTCRFEPRQEKTIYCAKTDLLQPQVGQLQEANYLSVFKIDTRQEFPLLSLPQTQGVQISISPDGVGLLFDQVLGTLNPALMPRESSFSNTTLYLLPLPDLETRLRNNQTPAKVTLEQLYPGARPLWFR